MSAVPAVLRVVQLNAGSLLEPGWEERRLEIVAWLDHLEPDVVCLQEVWEDANTANTATWLAERSEAADWQIAFGGDSFDAELWPDSTLRFGSAVLSRWPIDEERYIRLPVAGDGDGTTSQVPWELFHAKTAGLDVFSVHLAAAPTDGHHRRVQVLAIDEYVRSVRGDLDRIAAFGVERVAMPAVMCGDFNAEPDSDEIRFLTSLAVLDGRTTFWQDAWRVAGEGVGHTQDWRTNPIAAAMNIHAKRIDYVFVGDPFQRRGGAGRVLSADLAFHTSRTGVLASDHAGVVAEILWPDRPPAA
jgi:endonuclease/exonuclease/phosphatase family metal-dependent hydrolase